MRNNWTLEWYIENQFSKDVKRAFQEDHEGKGIRMARAARVAFEMSVKNQ